MKAVRTITAGNVITALALLAMTACASVQGQVSPVSTVAAAAPAPAAPAPVCPKMDLPPSPPEGWTYLPEVSALCVADVFHGDARVTRGQPSPQIVVATRKNVGILEHPVDVPLDAATRLQWKWNVTQIPSKLPENVAADHDYLSIAVKFDNGQDLTYMWSASLEPGIGFRCPLPGWDTRETHVVLRSGEKDLGKWLSEKRNVRADYAKYIGGKPPARITHVWLIANSIFHQGAGDARFGDITLGGSRKGKRTRVL